MTCKKKKTIPMTFLINAQVKSRMKSKTGKLGITISAYIESLVKNDLKTKPERAPK